MHRLLTGVGYAADALEMLVSVRWTFWSVAKNLAIVALVVAGIVWGLQRQGG